MSSWDLESQGADGKLGEAIFGGFLNSLQFQLAKRLFPSCRVMFLGADLSSHVWPLEPAERESEKEKECTFAIRTQSSLVLTAVRTQKLRISHMGSGQ